LRAHYYDPSTGRFISKDPMEGVLTNPQTQNPYAYALNSPVNLSDPSGEFAIPLLFAAGLYITTTASSPDFQQDLMFLAQDLANCDWGSASVDAISAMIPGLSAGMLKVVNNATDVAKSLNVTFGHGARHLEGTNLAQDVVESLIRSDVNKQGAGPTGELIKRTIQVDGETIQYHSYTLPDGTVNIGTYYIPPK